MIYLFDRFTLFLNVNPSLNKCLNMDNPINGHSFKSVLVKEFGKMSITVYNGVL